MLLLTILVQFTTAQLIQYSLSDTTIQSLPTALELNITATFASQDIKVEITLPAQIPSQDKLVCGVSGLTSGSCNLLFSKFVITFKSATPSFQVKFINMENPLTDFTDPVLINAFAIATQQVIFQSKLQLKYTQLQINPILSFPQTTYEIGDLTVGIDLTGFKYPKDTQMILQTDAAFKDSQLLGFTFKTVQTTGNSISLTGVNLPAGLANFNVTRFQILTLKPYSLSIILRDEFGIITQKQMNIQAKNLAHFPVNIQSDSHVIGVKTNFQLQICGLHQESQFQVSFTSDFSSPPQPTVTYNSNSCHQILFPQIVNPKLLQTYKILVQAMLFGQQSANSEASYTTTRDKANLAVSQNNTIPLQITLATLNLTFARPLLSPTVKLSVPFALLSCSSSASQCESSRIILNGEFTFVTVQIEFLLNGCNSGAVSAEILIDEQPIAESNSVAIKSSGFTQRITLDSSNREAGRNSTFTLNFENFNSHVSKYQIDSQIQILECKDCQKSTSSVVFTQQSGSLTFNAVNLKSNKQIAFVVKAFQEQCLLYTEQLSYRANPVNVVITAEGSNYILNMKSNWSITITPEITDTPALLRVPLAIPLTEPLRFNDTHIQVRKISRITLNNLTNVGENMIWEVSYLVDNSLYGYGRLVTRNLSIMQFENIQVTQNNKAFAKIDQLRISFSSLFSSNGGKFVLATNLNIVNTTLNNLTYDSSSPLTIGNHSLALDVEFQESTKNNDRVQVNMTSFDQNGMVLQQSLIEYQLNYSCPQPNCELCDLSRCARCGQKFKLIEGFCALYEDLGPQSNQSNEQSGFPQRAEPIQTHSSEDNVFKFTPPVLSPLLFVLLIFAVSRKFSTRQAEAFIIFYSLAAILEHIISVFLLVWYFLELNITFGVVMVSIILVHFLAQTYLVIMSLFRIDPEYIGARQKYKGIRILHILSLTFCGRLMLLMVSKFSKSYIWNQPWSNRVSILTRLQNLVIFQLVAEAGMTVLTILSMIEVLYFFYIEILVFFIVQLSVSIYTYYYLKEQKNFEIRQNYV